MPLYEFLCGGCGRTSEAIQLFSDPLPTTCDQCGGTLKKLVSQSTVQFKGSGWYVSDYAKAKSSEAKGEEKSNTEKSADGTTEKGGGESKPSESKGESSEKKAAEKPAEKKAEKAAEKPAEKKSETKSTPTKPD